MAEGEIIDLLLVRKYDQPVSGYLGYPSLPFWDNNLDPDTWGSIFQKEFNDNNHIEGISLYIHLPFCKSLCTNCGCNQLITQNHSIEDEYLLSIAKEWKMYRNLMQQTPVIREIRLGGGTPAIFSPKNLHRLLSFILKNSIVHPVHEFSIDGLPNDITREHLGIFNSLGFRTVNYDLLDNDPTTQKLMNRIQPFDNVKNATAMARETGFTTVNFHLTYGLPKQSIESIENTMEQVITLMPGRIAFCSYDYVSRADNTQSKFEENDLPDPETKISIHLKGRELLLQHGYVDIGMDQFALPNEPLYKAWQKGKLHRNFLGYTAQKTALLLGLGISGVSDTGTAFAQNETTLQAYYTAISNNRLAVKKGYILSEEDLLVRKNILELCCKGKTSFSEKQSSLLEKYTFPELAQFAADGLVKYDKAGLEVTGEGHFFIRNICSAFDMHLKRNNLISGKAIFTQALS